MAQLGARIAVFAAGTLAVAAVVLLAAALPWSALVGGGPQDPPAAGPAGLPTRLDTPEPWTPQVTDQPIETASVLFPGEVVHSAAGRGVGLFVLSADGRHYRRLPWTGDQSGTLRALSADGRWVAWTDPDADLSGIRPVVHLLRLRDGLRRDIRLPGLAEGSTLVGGALALLPQERGLLVSGQAIDPRTGESSAVTWRAELDPADGEGRTVCACTGVLGLTSDGTVYRSEQTRQSTGLDDVPVLKGTGRPGQPAAAQDLVAVAPGGSAWARGGGDHTLEVVGAAPAPEILEQPQGSSPQVLGWGTRGVLVRWQVDPDSRAPNGGRLVWVDPERRTTRTVAELPAWTGERVPVVAAGLLDAPAAVLPARPEAVPWWSGRHRQDLAVRGLVWVFGLGGVLTLAGLPLIIGRLKERDGADLRHSSRRAGNQGRLW